MKKGFLIVRFSSPGLLCNPTSGPLLKFEY